MNKYYKTMKFIRNALVSLSLLVIVYSVGFQMGVKQPNHTPFVISEVSNKKDEKGRVVDFSLFWDVWDRLSYYFIDKNNLNPQNMVYGAISGMVASLGDPYTVFLPPEQNKEAKDDLGGKFEGIGAQLGVKDKKIVVIAPLKGTPADKAGLLAGDWIIKVDGQDTINWTIPEAVSKIRGQKGSSVILTILHKDAAKSADIKVLRDEIKVPSVEWKAEDVICEGGKNCTISSQPCELCSRIIYLKLGRFGDETSSDWNNAVDQIVNLYYGTFGKNIKGLILDLRNNPGGYLSGSVFITSEFLKDGIVVIQENATGAKKEYEVDRNGKLTDIPMVVLINKGSASASEIVAGSLKVHKRSKLVGETTFGKGTIQEAQELAQGAGIHITTAKWLLPDNTWVNGGGIDPDVVVENDETQPDVDLQLYKAVDLLLK